MDAFIVGAVFGSLLIGTLCGLAPFLLGKKYKNKNLGIAGFFTCVISGFILGIVLAAPVAAIFSLIIYLSRDEK